MLEDTMQIGDLRCVSNEDLDKIVEGHIICYVNSYGRRMMQGVVRAMLGVTSRAFNRLPLGLH